MATPVIVQQQVELELHSCPGCGAWVALEPAQWKRRRNGEDGGSYTCPNGHIYGWWETPEQREQKRAEVAERLLRDAQTNIQALQRDRDGLLETVSRLKRRANAGVCLDCHRTFQDLMRHRASKHAGKEGA